MRILSSSTDFRRRFGLRPHRSLAILRSLKSRDCVEHEEQNWLALELRLTRISNRLVRAPYKLASAPRLSKVLKEPVPVLPKRTFELPDKSQGWKGRSCN